ncbi:hypothetical protein B7C42_02330 [Nocardia cerradoensis]|uniref:Uncharacterized protein n=1 Tax=Nocardia cerradoensis TaxID=85688 RepID=A0A231H8M6_9NOCA|nr:hypothetical protein [Nocardia cerradoensis]NKY47864.1 hypothetical protein [Nocardia cerradoensis]OXR45205.1 hypothetical protein B7C42_02330 [Nocardia cerradoensis]
MSTRTTRLGLVAGIRVVAALVVVGSAVAVTALTVHQNDQVTSVVVHQEAASARAAASSDAPAAPAPAAKPPAPGAPAGPGPAAAPAAAVPLGGATAPAPGVGPANSGAPNRSTPLGPSASGPNAAAPGANGSVPLAGNPFAAPAVNTQPRCPLGWPAPGPDQQGGLASLIGLAPLAGPFSSEAFALGSVYQPLLQLAGPVLSQIAPVIAHYQPVIDPFITQVQGAEAVVLQAILPYYGPYRDQLIAAEGDLARQLAPVLDQAYNSELASCFVAWQGQIIDQAKGGPIHVASLAHPGTVVELGPKP